MKTNGMTFLFIQCRCLELLDLLGIDKITGECLQRVPQNLPCLTLLDLRQCNRVRIGLLVEILFAGACTGITIIVHMGGTVISRLIAAAIIRKLKF